MSEPKILSVRIREFTPAVTLVSCGNVVYVNFEYIPERSRVTDVVNLDKLAISDKYNTM